MTFFFDIQKLERATKLDPEYIFEALKKAWQGRTIPKNAWEKHKPIPGIVPGNSFLINPQPLFEDTSTNVIFKAQYIRLAGLRDYFSYKTLKQTHLDLTLYPDLNLLALQQNTLLTIHKNHLKFIYEEQNGTVIQTNQRQSTEIFSRKLRIQRRRKYR